MTEQPTPPNEASSATPEAVAADGPSPWSSDEKLDPSLLPSASLGFLPSAQAAEGVVRPATEPPVLAEGSRRALAAGVAVVVVVLLGAIAYFALWPSSAGSGPASVRLGADGAELEPDPEDPAAAGTATIGPSASVEQVAPRPVRRPRPAASPKAPGRYVPDDL